MTHSNDLENLLNVPMDQRDVNWEERFFMAFTSSNVNVMSPDPQQGPDGWPYLIVETGPSASEPAQKVIQWLATRGIGLVVNPSKSYPDFVFNFGMLWHFKQTGLFYRKQTDVRNGAVAMNEGQRILAGAPTEEYLPGYARKILRDFFRDQGLLAVKILMVSQDGNHYDLAFSLESLGNPPQKEHEGVAEAISWFLPPHYSILLTTEQGLPEFISL